MSGLVLSCWSDDLAQVQPDNKQQAKTWNESIQSAPVYSALQAAADKDHIEVRNHEATLHLIRFVDGDRLFGIRPNPNTAFFLFKRDNGYHAHGKVYAVKNYKGQKSLLIQKIRKGRLTFGADVNFTNQERSWFYTHTTTAAHHWIPRNAAHRSEQLRCTSSWREERAVLGWTS